MFLDETAVKIDLTRVRGRAPEGARLIMDAPFGSWGARTLIAGLAREASIAPWVIEGAMDGLAFAVYVKDGPRDRSWHGGRPAHPDRWRSGPHHSSILSQPIATKRPRRRRGSVF